MIDMDAYTRKVHQKYLDAKYAEYDDESDMAYKKRKHVHKPVKKSDHKHEYENVVVIYADKPDSFQLVGRCNVCGKIGKTQRDKRIDKKFPHVYYRGFGIGHPIDCEDEYEAFKKWCKEHYTVYEVDDFSEYL